MEGVDSGMQVLREKERQRKQERGTARQGGPERKREQGSTRRERCGELEDWSRVSKRRARAKDPGSSHLGRDRSKHLEIGVSDTEARTRIGHSPQEESRGVDRGGWMGGWADGGADEGGKARRQFAAAVT